RLAPFQILVDDQIALRRRRRADADRCVRHPDVERVLVGVGIDRDRLDPQAPSRLDDPAGDLAAVGDENALEHALLSQASAGWLCGFIPEKSMSSADKRRKLV